MLPVADLVLADDASDLLAVVSRQCCRATAPELELEAGVLAPRGRRRPGHRVALRSPVGCAVDAVRRSASRCLLRVNGSSEPGLLRSLRCGLGGGIAVGGASLDDRLRTPWGLPEEALQSWL